MRRREFLQVAGAAAASTMVPIAAASASVAREIAFSPGAPLIYACKEEVFDAEVMARLFRQVLRDIARQLKAPRTPQVAVPEGGQ